VANIVAETLTQMHQAYGTKVKDVHAAIGPSIGECCYEVDERVLTAVNDVLGYARFGAGKAMLDLKEINRQIMIKTGILQNHIEISEACTSCRTDLYFSHRAEHGKTGRMASWIGLMAKE
jgi:copper oxidase (laccase) domain-containing protein